jgi:hypothetical protein
MAAEAASALGQDGYSYLLTMANNRAIGGKGADMLTAYGITPGEISREILLDERAREFPGEQMRWFDLKRFYRPEEFVERIKKYNPDAQNISVKHYLRPIPQIQLDAIENAAELGQNPGY